MFFFVMVYIKLLKFKCFIVAWKGVLEFILSALWWRHGIEIYIG